MTKTFSPKPSAVVALIYLVHYVGDPPGLAPEDFGAHGSPAQRVESFRMGYRGGIVTCGIVF